MAPRKQLAKPSEFPILEANGLYASETKGDGEQFRDYFLVNGC
jgi:hypothetical protein